MRCAPLAHRDRRAAKCSRTSSARRRDDDDDDAHPAMRLQNAPHAPQTPPQTSGENGRSLSYRRHHANGNVNCYSRNAKTVQYFSARIPVCRSSRRLSDFSDIAHLTVSFHGISLTPRQHKLIKTAYDRWRRTSDRTAGEWALEYVARRDSQLRLEFERHSELAKVHATAITDVLDMAVESVESLDDSLGPLLVSYASQNGVLCEKECFDRHYWTRVSEALCQLARQFPTKGNKWDTIAAWRIVILFIVNKIDYGFQLEKKDAQQSPHSFDNQAYKN